MRATPELVRRAIAHAILEVIRVGMWSDEAPGVAQSRTLDRYWYLGPRAIDLAADVRDWFAANGPYGGEVSEVRRRLMLALWGPEKFVGWEVGG